MHDAAAGLPVIKEAQEEEQLTMNAASSVPSTRKLTVFIEYSYAHSAQALLSKAKLHSSSNDTTPTPHHSISTPFKPPRLSDNAYDWPSIDTVLLRPHPPSKSTLSRPP